MKVSSFKVQLYLLFFTWMVGGYNLMGCGDHRLATDNPGSNSNNVQNIPPAVDEFVGDWQGTMDGVLQGMEGDISVTLSNGNNILSGALDVTNTINTPSDVTVTGTVGVGKNNPLEGIYTFSLMVNDNPMPTECFGWNVFGAGTLNAARDKLTLTCLGVFCGPVVGSLGLSSAVLTLQE